MKDNATTLVCARCLKEWVDPHSCDVAYGDTLVTVELTEDFNEV